MEQNVLSFCSFFVLLNSNNHMKINEKFLHEIVNFLYNQSSENFNESFDEVDIRYYEGKRNAFEQIALLLLGDNYELCQILQQMTYHETNVNELTPF